MSEEFQTWRQHFIDQAKGLIPHQRKFYKVSMQEGKGKEPAIKMISPVQSIINRAKSEIAHPPSVYDPVTGIMQQTNRKHVKVTSKRKQSRKTKPKQAKSTTKSKSKSTKKTKGKVSKKRKKTSKVYKVKNKWWQE